MSLKALLEKGTLHAHQSSKKELAGLFALADRSLADARVAGLSSEGRLTIAYNAALTAATIALRASGHRTNSNLPGHHAVTLESLAYTLGTKPNRVERLHGFRRKRNRVSYDAPIDVSGHEAGEMLALAAELRQDVELWLRKKHPGLV